MQRGRIVASVLAVSVVFALSGCGGSSDDASAPTQEAVSVHLMGVTSNDALALEKKLSKQIGSKAAGHYDETRWFASDGGGEAELLAVGPDAEALWAAMKPVVQASRPTAGSYVIKTFGDATSSSAKTERIELAP